MLKPLKMLLTKTNSKFSFGFNNSHLHRLKPYGRILEARKYENIGPDLPES